MTFRRAVYNCRDLDSRRPAVLSPRLLLNFDTDATLENVLESSGRILIVIVLAVLAVWLLHRLITPAVRVALRQQMEGEPEIEVAKRIDTLTNVIHQTILIMVAVVAVITVLPEFGISAGPLIAGLGLVGLAVGFGAQGLVRDVINGLSILIENQYGRGDFVEMANVRGVVEDMNLRRTVLRDFDGTVHFVSHGLVQVTSNKTRGFSRIILDVVVAYSEDMERVFQVIDTTGRELTADAEYNPRIRQAPRARGLDALGESTVAVRVEGVTEPGEQWIVAGELRRRLKAAFDAAGIRVRDVPPVSGA